MHRLIAAGAVALGVAGAAASPAAAALAPCDRLEGYNCGSIEVPLDRSRPALGSATVSFAVRPHDNAAQPAEGTVLTTRAPGEATVTEFGGWLFSYSLGDLTATRDIVLVDVRGTGADALDCPDYQHGVGPFSVSVASCAAQLGATADYYGYGDMADDMDAVRAALGLDRVDVYATGHATPVAEAYAVHYPQRTRSLVLDSAANFTAWPDEALRNTLRASTLICRRSPLCSAEIRDPDGELEWLIRRLRREPLTGIGRDADGAPHRIRLGETELAYLVLFDQSGALRTQAELPAAARALREGDALPLLRLAAETDRPLGVAPFDTGDPAEESRASHTASYCNQWPLGWNVATPPAERLAQYGRATAALPRDFFAPFAAGAVLTGPDEECLAWPAPTRMNPIVPPGVAYPRVPTLVVHGDLNLDHALIPGARVAARFPAGRFVAIPQAGQSAAGWSACARRLIARFMTALATGPTACQPSEGGAFPGLGSFPRRAADYVPATVDRPGADDSRRADRKVVAVAVQTYLDALYTKLFRSGGATGRGLRGGTTRIEFGDTGATLTLDHVRLAEDVEVSGTTSFAFENDAPAGRLTVTGAGTDRAVIELSGDSILDPARPTLRVGGRIGGRRLSLLVPIH